MKSMGKGNYGRVKLESLTVESRPSLINFIRSGFTFDMMVNLNVNIDPIQVDVLSSTQFSKCTTDLAKHLDFTHYQAKNYRLFFFGGEPLNFVAQQDEKKPTCFPFSQGSDTTHGLEALLTEQIGLIQKVSSNQVIAPVNSPTKLAPVVRHARSIVQKRNITEKSYSVVVILTSTDINDTSSFIKELQLCVSLPMSVIVIGSSENEASFSKLIEINNRYSNMIEVNGQQCVRDLFSFTTLFSIENSLKVIPEHFIQYAEKAQITPQDVKRSTSKHKPRYHKRKSNSSILNSDIKVTQTQYNIGSPALK